MPVGDGAHHAAHRQAVEIVVDKDQHAQGHGGQLRAGPGLDVLGSPLAEGRRAACLVHQGHHGAQDDQEHQNAHVVAVRQNSDDAAGEHVVHGAFKGEPGVQHRAHHNADEQRGIHLFGDEGQADGHHRRQQGPEGRVQAGNVLRRRVLGKGRHGEQEGEGQNSHRRCEKLFFAEHSERNPFPK